MRKFKKHETMKDDIEDDGQPLKQREDRVDPVFAIGVVSNKEIGGQ